MKSTKTKTYLVTLTLTDFHLFLDLFLLYCTVPVSVLFLKRICCFFINPTKKPNQLGSAINKIRCLSFCRTNE